MTQEISTVYESAKLEAAANDIWNEGNFFHPTPGEHDNSYTIVIPPPNVTAALHLGHALNNTLQDILIRFKRMQGFNTLWMPGTDHAGIATQTVVEKRLLAEQGKRRTDFERKEFVEHVQAWKDEYEQRIIEQLKGMGCSCDWERVRFTMDETCAKAVRATFFKLFRDGLIYRGKRLVNWDPATQTVLADDEVEHQTVQGHFWYMKYPLVEPVEVEGEKIEYVTVATTRPETMLGDTAVAMNPSDPRAKALVGKMVKLPIAGREIPIIADTHVVLPDAESEDEKARFSTGFLKVTPAHDPNDWEIGQRHNLPVINVMAPDGSISDKFGWTDGDPDADFVLGMDRFEARAAIVEWFKEEKLLAEVRDYAHEVGHSYRSHVPIEPYLSDQWYVAVKKPIEHLADKFGDGMIEGTDVPVNSLAGLALKPLLDGELKFTPPRYAKTYQTWLENLRDWPISRQLWWGHQIPVWKKTIGQGQQMLSELFSTPIEGIFPNEGEDSNIFPFNFRVKDLDYDIPIQTREEGGVSYNFACIPPDRVDIEKELEKRGWKRDEDVLDTWFSSALWPFSTMGWPEQTEELKSFYPGDVLCTAREIITLWVSRMVMMGQYCAGDIPFKDVYIHAMIQDGQGRKMSKSLGNGIDPLVVIDSHGADSMRFTLASMTTDTQDVRMPVELMTLPDGRKVNTSPKFDNGRNFCNKLWNASRFAMINLEGLDTSKFDAKKLKTVDKWILSKLADAVEQVTKQLNEFKFNEPASELYKFFWNDLCDWYLEWCKPRMNDEQDKHVAQNVLAFVLDTTLRLLHPFVPFITEGIYNNLRKVSDKIALEGTAEFGAAQSISMAQWPSGLEALKDKDVEEKIESIQNVIRGIRDIRSQYNIPPSKKLTAGAAGPEAMVNLLNENCDLVCQLAGLDEFAAGFDMEKSDNAAAAVVGDVSIFVDDVIDPAEERKHLEKQKANIEKQLNAVNGKLSNENFVSRAKPEVVAQAKEKQTELNEQMETVEKHLAAL